MLQVNLDDVVAAGRVLFGPAFRADGQAWRVDLKTTYRRRALETHPDRARAVGRTETELSLEFRRVSEAYRVLSQLAGGPLPAFGEPGDEPEPPPPPPPPRRPRHRTTTHAKPAAESAARPAAEPAAKPAAKPAAEPAARPPPRPERPPEPASTAAASPASGASAAPSSPGTRAAPAPAADVPGHRVRYSVHPDAMPRRKLRFAEFLYYSGRVPWTAFVESLAWQRKQRPPVGRIAVEWGFLDPEDVSRIMEERRVRGAQQVPFGEFAVRMGYLTSFQLLAVLGRQLRMQRRIGDFFVERGYIEASEIDDIRRRILRHNVRWRE